MPRRLHRFEQMTIPRLAASVRYPRPQSMRRELRWLQTGHLRPLLQDRVDGLRVERPLRNRAPAPDLPEDAALVDLGRRHPGLQRLDRSAGQIDDVILLAAGGLGPTEMDGKRGEGRRSP